MNKIKVINKTDRQKYEFQKGKFCVSLKITKEEEDRLEDHKKRPHEASCMKCSSILISDANHFNYCCLEALKLINLLLKKSMVF